MRFIILFILSLSSLRAETGVHWITEGLTAEERFDSDRVIALLENIVGPQEVQWEQVITIKWSDRPEDGELAHTYSGAYTVHNGLFVASTAKIELNTDYYLSRSEFMDVLFHECGHYFGVDWALWWGQELFGTGEVFMNEEENEYIGPASEVFFIEYGNIPFSINLSHFLFDENVVMFPVYNPGYYVGLTFWAVIEDQHRTINWSKVRTGTVDEICPRRRRRGNVTHNA